MIIDIITLLFVAMGLYQGFTKGLVKTIFSVLAVIIAVVAALKLSPLVIGLLQNIFSSSPALTFVIGFVLTFVAVMALVRFVGNRIEKLMASLHIGGVNKILGAFLLSLFYAILISYGVFFMDRIDLISEKQKAESITYPMLKPLPGATQRLGETLKPVFSGFWESLNETIDKIKDKGEQLNEEGE